MTLKDRVPARCYYYLLDFNDRNGWDLLVSKFGKKRLADLTEEEFWQLFKEATEVDMKYKDGSTGRS
jgi:diadenosine tetraphosphate (Ap4A) HIT family hydrolase